jgi:DNA polymerase III subunit alpha
MRRKRYLSVKNTSKGDKENMKLSLYSLEKGVTMNDEIVHWLEENADVDVQVVVA